MTQKTLAVELSRLASFKDASTNLEQYSTESNVAAELIWDANNFNLIKDKTIVDLGAGTGILGIGCLLMGAKHVIFVEKDSKAIQILKTNLKHIETLYEITGTYEIIHTDIVMFNKSADVVIQNPPFGTKTKNIDAVFLEKALFLAPTVITMHKTTTEQYIQDIISKKGFTIIRNYHFKYPLKKTMPQHKQAIEYINVSGWLLERNN